jgi:YesN/AraC family two-component response regulator
MTRIIFVDDEPKVLAGIRRFLYSMRREWDMSFACSGLQALEIMSRNQFDVIVTDVRMPGMDGTELLARVRDLHPGVVRIILSGYSDRDLSLKAAASAHRYLSKPCGADSLKTTIARAVAAH